VVKFDRQYLLRVQQRPQSIVELNPDYREIKLPFTMEFDVQQNTLSSASTSSIRVYNLSDKVRALMRHDEQDYDLNQRVILQAGYGQNLSTIVDAYIYQAWSVREGTNFITQIECHDGGFAFVNGYMEQNFTAGEPYLSIIESAIAALPGVSIGKIGNFSGSLLRGNTYAGNPVDILNQITGGSFFVSQGKAYCLKDNEAIQGQIEVINSKSGLLGTPVRQRSFVNIEMLFEPRLLMAQKVRLESSTGDSFNSDYKVVSLHHRGMISPTTSGNAITRVGLAPGDFIL